MSGVAIRGWCPGVVRPMRSGDGLVLRVRPPLSLLTAAQAHALADAAEAFGRGEIQLTNRANLQLRGLAEDELAPLVGALARAGLVDPTLDAAAEARLNVIVAPFWTSGGGWDAPAVWTALRAALVAEGAPRLPAKFGFAVDAGPARCLGSASADVRIETAGGAWLVRADGAPTGRRARDPHEAAALAVALARWFVASGGVGPDGRGRMRDHVAAGARPPAALTGDARPDPEAAPAVLAAGGLVGFDFGLVAPDALRRLARHAPEGLRLTPWRAVFAPGLRDAAALADDPALLRDPDDPRLRRFACVGAPSCPQGRGDPRALARRLGLVPQPGRTLHVSGCEKGCAHPGPADLTVVFGATGLGVVRGGRAGDAPPRRMDAADLERSAREWADAACL